jgi:hypothetical protein
MKKLNNGKTKEILVEKYLIVYLTQVLLLGKE